MFSQDICVNDNIPKLYAKNRYEIIFFSKVKVKSKKLCFIAFLKTCILLVVYAVVSYKLFTKRHLFST